VGDATTLDGSQVGGALGAGPPRVYLVVREGGGARVVDVDDGADVVFGRAATATVRLDDAKASREHARFVRKGDVVEVIDLGSRNGTQLNGALVAGARRVVRSGDVVRIGKVEILVAETAGIAAARDAPRDSADAQPSGIVVGDPAMVAVFERVRKVAVAPTTVLILGETGVGKEVVAEQIHRLSPRKDGPFLRLNCASLPETLLESELFGHEKGAFTGADKRKPGFVEAAQGGTLFLDEVGELSPATQARLLRVLENRRFTRVGGREELQADIRIVAATNRELEAESKAGRFRADLYFRLSAFVIRVPPLRERAAELELLAELFARQAARRLDRRAPRISPAAMQLLRQHAWPGNVRELRNAMEHAVVIADGGVVEPDALPDSLRAPPPRSSATANSAAAHSAAANPSTMRAELADVEKRRLQEALDAEDGNQTRAAKRLGISRRALQYKMEKHDLKG
jgi:two-component system, NtrC family, response regulator AtoC